MRTASGVISGPAISGAAAGPSENTKKIQVSIPQDLGAREQYLVSQRRSVGEREACGNEEIRALPAGI